MLRENQLRFIQSITLADFSFLRKILTIIKKQLTSLVTDIKIPYLSNDRIIVGMLQFRYSMDVEIYAPGKPT